MSILSELPVHITTKIEMLAVTLRCEPQAVIVRALEDFIQRYDSQPAKTHDPFYAAASEDMVIQSCHRIMVATDMQASDHSYFRNNSWKLLEAISIGLFRDQHEWLSFSRVREIVNGGLPSMIEWFDSSSDRGELALSFVRMTKEGSKNADIILDELERRLSLYHQSLPSIPS